MASMGDNGIYLVYRVHLENEERGVEQRLLGRFALVGGVIHILEDHDGLLADIFPPGKLTDRILDRLEQMEHSAYWRIVIDQGEGDEQDIPEMHAGTQQWQEPAPEPEKG